MAQRTDKMLRRQFVAQTLTLGTASVTLVSLGGCGTLLHSERLHQPHSRDLDWKIVALNGLGLIFFFVPGVIAFVVDFYTGAIYLPPEYGAAKPPTDDEVQHLVEARAQEPQPVPLEKVAVLSGELNLVAIEREVTQQVGKPVWLSDPAARATRLDSLEQFADNQQRCRTDRAFGLTPRAFLHRWMPQLGTSASAS